MTFSLINHGKRRHIGVKPLFALMPSAGFGKKTLLFALLSLLRFFLIHICCQSEILPTVSLLFVLQCNDLSIYSWLHVRFFPPLQNSYTWPKFRKRWCKTVTLPNYAGVCGYFWNGDAHRAHHLFTCHVTYSVRWHKEACIVASEIKKP